MEIMEEIAEKVQGAIKRLFDVDFAPEMTAVPERAGADYATNAAMKLFGQLKAEGKAEEFGVSSPREVASKIAEVLGEDKGFLFDTEVAGPGFLNFISRDEYFKQELGLMRADFLKNISQDEYSGKRVICEFSDPNPFKVLHVGHLYTSIVGDAISRVVEFARGEVVRANFGGDVGLHVAKTLYEMTTLLERSASSEDALLSRRTLSTSPSGAPSSSQSISTNASLIEYIADCYVKGTRAYEDDEGAKREITRLNKEIYEIAEAGPEQKWDGEKQKLAELYWTGREASYQYFAEFYEKVGVKFDKYYPESTVAKRGLKEVSAYVGEVYEESNGAIIFPGEKYGLHTRVFINKEGLPTYEAKDVGLIFTKWDDYHFDKSIVITGNDIIDYMKVVLCSVEQYAPELPARTLHLAHGNVRLPGNEKMSSRKGNFVKAVDVLDEVTKEVGSDDPRIALAAVKYAFLKYKIGGNIEFDVKESVSTTGNSGVYLQYSAVRAKKILEKISKNPDTESSWTLGDNEKKMIRKLCEYKQVLSEVVKELAPHKLANYLYETAQEFSRFYENVKVAGSEYEGERAEIVAAYLDVMTHGLSILGIEVPEEM